jgi:hypothetical protein
LATFYPGWHLSTQGHIQLSLTEPKHHIEYSGMIDINAMNSLLVARKLTLTSVYRLSSKSRRLIMPVRDELFIFE